MGTNSPLSADPFIHKDLNYDPIKDFVPITRVGSFTLMLVVNPKLPIHSVKELADYGKANPGHLSFAIVGGYTVAKWAEISMLHVPYKTTGPALTIPPAVAKRFSPNHSIRGRPSRALAEH
jgi:tripartite-type tricarboxylate transporter receptor subunit TctC